MLLILPAQLIFATEHIDPVFRFEVPVSCPGLPDDVLYPPRAWPDEAEYWDRYRQLAARYVGNFRKFADQCPPELAQAGPITQDELAAGGR